MAHHSQEVEYWVSDYRHNHLDQAIRTEDQNMLEDAIEQIVERAVESFEFELRDALLDAMNDRLEQIEDETTCDSCGDEITDANRPDGTGFFGPDSGYCAECAASNE